MGLNERFDQVLEIASGLAEGPPTSADRVLRMVYEPSTEQEFRTALGQFLKAVEVRNLPCEVVDLRLLPFQLLEQKDLLTKSFEFQARKPDLFNQDLARRLGPAVVDLVARRSIQLGPGLIVMLQTAALFPWVSYSSVLKQLPPDLPSVVLLTYPGTETAASLKLLGRRNGFDYMARRV